MGYLTRTNNSLYVKAYLQQELRNQSMALSLEKGVGAFSERFSENVMDTLASVGDGAGRLAGRGVCLFLGDNETCSGLRYYDQRMMICIAELIKRTDAILDMLYLCIVYVLQRYDDKMQLRILAKIIWYMADCKNYSTSLCQNLELDDGKIEEVLRRLQDPDEKEEILENLIGESIYPVTARLQKMAAKGAARLATDMVTEGILAYTAATYIAGSASLSKSVKTVLSRSGGTIISFVSNYGKVTQATGTTERLKLCNPKLYHLLYINHLEMFFFLFDKYLPSAIYQGDYAFATEEDAVRFFKGMIK